MANTATSMYFDGTDDFLIVEDTTIGEIGDDKNPGPFTIETWVKVIGHSGGGTADRQSIASRRSSGAGTSTTGGWFWDIWSSGIHFGGYYGAQQWLHGGSGGPNGAGVDYSETPQAAFPTDSEWHHCVVERIGEANAKHLYVIFIDGKLQKVYRKDGTGGNFLRGQDTDKLAIGNNAYNDEGSTDFHGYMDEFRFSHTARYGNFKAPNAPLAATQTASIGMNALKPENVTVLLQSDNTAANGTNVIGSTSNKGSGGGVVTATTGTPKIIDSESLPWKRTSFFINGSTDRWYLGTGTDAEPFANFGYDDFSIEAWLKIPTGSALPGYNMPLRATHNGGPSSVWYLNIAGQDSSGANAKTHFWYYDSPAVMISEENRHDAGDFKEWTHLAIVRENKDQYCLFSNGRLVNSSANGQYEAAHTGGTDYRLQFNYDSTDSNVNDAGVVYVDDVRICKGVAAYTVNFNPYGGQKNVVHNRGGAVTGARLASANTHAIQMGRAAIGSDGATNANTYHLHFDGTDDYLIRKTAGGTGTTQFRSDDDRGTIFAWINPDVVNSHGGIFSAGYTGDTHTFIDFYLSSGAKLGIQQRENDTVDGVTGDTSLTAGTWQSVAVVSSGTAWALYVNGTAQSLTVGSGTNTGEWFADTPNLNNITIGTLLRTSAADHFDGRIMQVAYWGGSSGTTGVLDADAIAALHAAGKSYDIKGSGNTGNYDSWTADLKGYWRMGNHYLDTPRVIHDASGNGYDMSINSVPNANTATGTLGTTFLPNWQHRGYFTPDKYTSLLLQSSTREGAVTFEDTGPGFKRAEFDGTNDYMQNTGLTSYRTSDTQGSFFGWAKLATLKDNNTIFSYGDTAGTTSYAHLFVGSTGKLSWSNVNAGVSTKTASVFPAGEWVSFAVTYDGAHTSDSYKIYINGVSQTLSYTMTHENNFWFSDNPGTNTWDAISIGALYRQSISSSQHLKGQISQLAIYGGGSGETGVLTATEVSAMHDLGPGGNIKTVTETGLVDYWTMGNLIGEGTDTSSTFYSQVTAGQDLTGTSMDAPFAGLTVGVNSTGTTHKTDKSIFGGSSIFFDGTDDVLQMTPATAISDWSGDEWTVEWWQNYQGTLAVNKTVWTTHAGISSPSKTGLVLMTNSDGKWLVSGSNDGTNWNVANNLDLGGPVTRFAWEHWAIVVTNGTTIKSYHNGILEKEATLSAQPTFSSSTFQIGGSSWGYWNSYIDEFRVSSIARYSKSIERFANTFVAKGDTGDAYTYLQINSNGAKNGAGWNDTLNRTGFGTTIMTVGAGNPIWRNSKGDPYGGANTALYFDGTSYLTIADNTNHDFAATDDATFECWVNFEKFPSSAAAIYGCGGEGHTGNPDGWGLRYNPATAYGTHGFYFNLDWASPYTIVATGPADNEFKVENRWYHCAVTKEGTLWSLYTDGVFKSSMTYSPAVNTATAFRLGYSHDGHASTIFTGYIDGFRISRGIVRYGRHQLRTTQQTHVSSNSDSGVVTSNSTFGTGTNLFTADANTAFLLQGDGTGFAGTNSDTFFDEATSQNTVTNNGGVTLKQGIAAYGANSYYFDGTDDYLYAVPTMLATDAWRDDGFCGEMWLRPTAIGTNGVADFCRLDVSNHLHMRFHNTHGFVVTFDSASGQVEMVDTNNDEFCKGFLDTWFHVAVQITNADRRSDQQLQLWINGNLYMSKSMDDKHFSGAGGVSIKYGFNDDDYYAGYMDQMRISTKERYNYSGTNAKVGTNAVHPNHCKLLITSNTFSGNTHFDDFSDQGNYWNQQPSSYYFDGTDAYIDVGGFPQTGTVYSVYAVWFKANSSASGSESLIGSRGGGTDNAYWLYLSQSNGKLGSSSEGVVIVKDGIGFILIQHILIMVIGILV